MNSLKGYYKILKGTIMFQLHTKKNILVNGCDPGWTENPATGKN